MTRTAHTIRRLAASFRDWRNVGARLLRERADGRMRSMLVVAAALVVVGCQSSTVCTLIGCLNGLTVEIQNAPAGPITVQAIEGTSGSVHTEACPGTSGCTNKIFFREFTPNQVHLTITTVAGTREQVAAPTYETSQPNGPKCGPTCRSGTVRVVWQ